MTENSSRLSSARRLAGTLVAALMVTAAIPECLAQNYEYSSSSQRNLTQIGVTRTLHTNLRTYISQYPAAQNVGIAILDGRVDAGHGDLQGRLSVHTVYGGTYTRNDNHGTHVAGIAGASLNNFGIVGVAPTARLFSIPVFDDTRWVATDNGKAALDKAVTLGARVANMSYGPSATGDVFLAGELAVFDDYVNSLVLVRSAGNTGANALNESYSGDASTSLAHLLIVGSVSSTNVISTFSNRPGEACIAGTTTCAEDDKMKYFFLVAPGQSILSDLTGNRFGSMNGTSMAAPHVAGAAALVFQDAYNGNTFLTPLQVADILKRSATDLGAKGVDGIYGWGLLNVAAALGPVGPTRVATTSTVSGSTTMTSSGTGITRSSTTGNSGGIEKMLEGMVVFDDYGRGFEMTDVELDAPRSTLADESTSALASSLLTEEVAEETETGRFSLVQTGGASTGYSGISFTSEGYGMSVGVGNTAAYFAQVGTSPERAFSQRLGSHFFTGSGEIGQVFTNGFHSGLDFTLSPRLTVSALYAHGSQDMFDGTPEWAQSVAEDGTASDLAAVGASLELGEAGTLGVSIGMLREDGAMLGMANGGVFSLGEAAYTQMAGVSFGRRITERLSLDAFAQFGLTSTTDADDTIFSSVSDLWSTKMGLNLTGTGVLTQGDALQLALVSPWRIIDGGVEARVAVGREFDGTVIYDERSSSLASGELPIDVGLSYTASAGAVRYGASIWFRDSDVQVPGIDETVASAAFSLAF